MDPRDALLKQALEALYWWGEEHGCCRGAHEDIEQAILAHLTSVGVPAERYVDWDARRKREQEQEHAAHVVEMDRRVAAAREGA